MLRRLISHEWKACARACLPVYGALLVVALVNRLFSAVGLENFLGGMPEMLAALTYFGVMVAVFVVTTVILIQRFYKSLLGDEGYLMFTLPVTVSQHIWAKAIVAFLMSVLSGVAALLSVLILASSSSLPQDILRFFSELFDMILHSEVGVANGIFYLLEGLAFFVLAALASLLFVYVCIALGHLAKKHRVAMAVVWYFVLSTALELLFGLVMLSGDGGVFQPLFSAISRMAPLASIHVVMLLLIAGTAIPAAAFFFGTRYVLQHKLNLE